jgi:hypothetical protein
VPTEAIVADEDVDDCEVDERVDREDMVQEGSARILPQDIVCYGQFVKVGPPTISATTARNVLYHLRNRLSTAISFQRLVADAR